MAWCSRHSGAKTTATTKSSTTSTISKSYVAKIEAVTPKTSVTTRSADRVTIGKWKLTPYKAGKLTSLKLSWPDETATEIVYGSSGDSGDFWDDVKLEVESGGASTSYEIVSGKASTYLTLEASKTYNLSVTGVIKSDKSVYGGLSISTFGVTLTSSLNGKNSYTWDKDDDHGVNSYFQASPDTDDGMIFGGVTFSVK